MSSLLSDPTVGWAAVLIVVLPVAIIGAGEFEERLRQRDSPLRRPVAIVRTWVLPLAALWVLVRTIFDVDGTILMMRVIGTALLFALTAASLAALSVAVAAIRDRPRHDGGRSVPRLLLALPRLLILLVAGWVLIAGVWDVDLSAALTALGVTSLVVSFALQDTLSGIASGFTLLADQPFNPGDWINTGEVEGRVVDVNWRSTRIRTRDGDVVIIPNGQLAAATITNFDDESPLHRVVVPIQVAYANSPTAAKDMLLAAARSTPGVLADPPPRVIVTQVDDPLMGYDVQMWVDDYTIAPRVQSDFGSLVWYHSHRMGVPLPSPAQDLYLWDGPRAAEEGRRDHASLRRGLRVSPLLAQLDDDEIDQLAGGATAARFAAGETILTLDDDDLVVIESGQAQLVVVVGSERREHVLDVTGGDLVAMLDRSEIRGHELALVAAGDCDVLILRSAVAGAVISRSPALAQALEQVGTSRRRRVLRLLRRLDAQHELESSGDQPVDGSIAASDESPELGDEELS